MLNAYRVPAGLGLLLALTVPAGGDAQGVAGPAGPLGEPVGSFVLFAGGTDMFGSEWGTGTLTFQGRTFKFSASGFRSEKPSEKTDAAEGTVYNLQSILDFPGFFSTMVGTSQPSSQYLQNEHYVIIHVTQSRGGVMFRTMNQPVRVDLAN